SPATALPKSTVAPARCVPVIVTGVPPIVQPVDGDTEVIVGSRKVYVSAEVGGVVPPGVLTLTSTVPGCDPMGASPGHSLWLHVSGSKDARVVPKYTTPLVRFWPMISTSPTPMSQPELGVTAVMDGGPGRK